MEDRQEKMKRQGLIVTLNQLHNLIEELENEFDDGSFCYETDDNRKFQINIINRTPECSDTWEIESQRKKDDEVTLTTKIIHSEPRSNTEEDNKKSVKTDVVDNHVDTDNLSNLTEAIDGCRTNPQDCSGQANVADKEDTNKSVLSGDFKIKSNVEDS